MRLPPGSRFYPLGACATTGVVGSVAGAYDVVWLWLGVPAVLLTLLGLRDLAQRRHAIIRNYPILGHLRFFLEYVRPEIRQYFIESDTEARPFSHNQRSIVYQRAKEESDKRPFGTQHDLYKAGIEWINHSITPSATTAQDLRITVGGPDCRQPYCASVFNISAMSFGALSANAIRALNHGAKKGGFAHDTGEGSISRYHREFGGDLIWEIGSGYFGCRDAAGCFDADRFSEQAAATPVKMIEVKLSQGAKPGHGGVLPGAKVTPEIASARGVALGVDCVSPAAHAAFSTPTGLLEFVARLRALSGGKPTGFKLCIGHPWEFFAIAKAMLATGITPDFIVIDGSEGGTGAAPAEFSDHVGVPMQEGLLLVHNTLIGIGVRDRVRLGASGKIITAFDIARTLAIGADWCNSARGFMFALGCLQAQTCHTGYCPTGITTQDPIRQRALVVPDKADRVFNFHRNTVRALGELLAAAGLSHPRELRPHHIVHRVSPTEVRLLSAMLPQMQPADLLGDAPGRLRHPVFELWWNRVAANDFALRGTA
ncbi:Ferredoxin-dependent glutamate synthase [Burkholderiales bacterium]|jgi:glutamate synthase domain-containing protein 2|nr:Ferredoxin-dependent glutamate synthase [Burkholderiales bacterium]